MMIMPCGGTLLIGGYLLDVFVTSRCPPVENAGGYGERTRAKTNKIGVILAFFEPLSGTR